MKNITLILFCVLAVFCMPAYSQKKVSELTLVYDAAITSGSTQPKMADAFDGATTTVY